MTFLFRVDSSQEMGLGHFMRCLAFAQYLKMFRQKCVFACRELLPIGRELLEENQIELIRLQETKREKAQSNQSYTRWLKVDEIDDIKELVEKTQGREVHGLIVDHYGIGELWEIEARNQFEKIFVIDDLGRTHNCHDLLDMTLNCSEDKYKNSVVNNRKYLGASFSLLRPQILLQRSSHFFKRSEDFQIKKILVTLGGGKSPALRSVLQALAEYQKKTPLQVAVAGDLDGFNCQEIADLLEKNKLRVLGLVKDMEKVYKEADLCIGAAGTSIYERACLGLPSLIIQTAENQQENLEAVEKNGLARVIKEPLSGDLNQKIYSRLQEFENKSLLEKLSKKSFQTISGLGIFEILEESFGFKTFKLRKVRSSDCELIFQWQSFSGARQYARNPRIPTMEEHKNWFERSLKNEQRDLWIFEAGDLPLAFLQLNRENRAEVSILVNFAFWGFGVGEKALRHLKEKYPNEILFAYIKPENKASIKLFKKCNFLPVGDDWYKNGNTTTLG